MCVRDSRVRYRDGHVVRRAVGQHTQRGALQVMRHPGEGARLIAGDQRLQDLDMLCLLYTSRKDGKTVITPNADILIYDGDLVRDWQIYIDVAPVYA